MATYKVRGIAHNIIYPYRTEDGKVKHQWETYSTELEAMHRKAYIDYLQKNRLHHEIRKAAAEYQCKRAVERAAGRGSGGGAEHTVQLLYRISHIRKNNEPGGDTQHVSGDRSERKGSDGCDTAL